MAVGQITKLYDVNSGETNGKAWSRQNVVVGDIVVTLWDDAGKLNEGDWVAYKEDGEYQGKKKYTGNAANPGQIDQASAQQPVQNVPAKQDAPPPEYDMSLTDKLISAQVAVKAATEMHVKGSSLDSFEQTVEKIFDNIMRLARK